MNLDNLNKTEDLLKFAETFLKNYFQNIERTKNKIICKNNITTEFIIDDVNKTTSDGFAIKRCYSVVTLLPTNLDLKFIAVMNNFSALSSFVSFGDVQQTKCISRFYEYEGENIHQRFLIPSLVTAAITNERIFHQVSKKVISKEEFIKGSDYEEVESRWITNSEFEETQSFLKDKFVCTASKNGMTVEFPWEEGATSAAMGHKTSLLEIITENKHPHFGSGLFCKLSLPVQPTDKSVIVNKLNLNEFSDPDAPPFIGSWCAGFKGMQIEFVCFFPNNVYFKGIVKNIIMWMFARAMIAKGFLE